MNNKRNLKPPLSITRKSNHEGYESHNRLITTKMGNVEKILPKEICRILDTCGSCSLLNEDYKTQLLLKSARLKEHFKELGSSLPQVVVQHFVESSEKLAYRQSVKLVVSEHFVNGKPWIDIGFYRQSLNKIVDIGNCPIQNSILNDIMYYLRSALKNFKIPIYSPKRKTGILSGLILRSSRSTKQTFVTLLVRELKPALFRELACNLIEKFSHVQGVFLQLENPEMNQKDSGTVLVAGADIIEEKFGTLNFKLSCDVELPIHPIMTSKVFSRVIELCELTGTQTVLHLYSGMGALSCLLAKQARMVYALDEKNSYVKNTELNLKFHNIKNVHVECGKISKTLPAITPSLQTCEAIIITAPRSGIDTSLIETVTKLSPKHIIFVSSFHEHMGSDLKVFAQNNYTPLFVEPFDTHPGTPYFEVLCYLKKSA
ncbi:MAG: 23S rRNA (uracil(1939)-C(5))-methyltransferase RlmD [Bdellovibrionota bacterium]